MNIKIINPGTVIEVRCNKNLSKITVGELLSRIPDDVSVVGSVNIGTGKQYQIGNETVMIGRDNSRLKFTGYNGFLFYNPASGSTDIKVEPTGEVRITRVLQIKERAAAMADVAAYGQLWVKTADPCELWFTDDAGLDTKIA